MNKERWQRIRNLYDAALEIETPQRTAFLVEACGEDVELRREVESLLEAGEKTQAFLSRPAMDLAARAMAEHLSDPSRTLPPLGERFEALAEAGRGGMGVVYRAWDRDNKEVVAIKALHAELESNPQWIECLQREVMLSRRVTHPNVCRIHDLHQIGDRAYISMEFIEGESLRRALNRFQALTVSKGIELVRQICEGLREAHNKAIIHRDLKPENIMIDQDGVVKVMDFGIARHQSAPRTLTAGAGTPAYMSPEQIEGRPVDARSDIYALGLVMYEIFTGQVAFVGATAIAVAHKQLTEMPPSPQTVAPGIPEDLSRILMRCIQKDPARRYQTLDALLDALRNPPAVTLPILESAPKLATLFPEIAYVVEPLIARRLLLVIEFGYLAMYFGALLKYEPAVNSLVGMGLSDAAAQQLLLFTIIAGIVARLYLISALAWNHPATGRQYWKLFPMLFVLGEMWAASPLLLLFAGKLNIGLTLAFAAGLAYLPFSEKTLMANAYRYAPAPVSAASSR